MKNPKQILTVALVAILVVFFCFSKTNASINESFTFQGKIVDDDGTNLTNSDATCVNDSGADTCDFRVSLYDATTGGNLLWQETKQDIEIGDNDGIFNLTLDCAGTFSNCYQGAYDDTIFSNGTDIYIQIEFDPDGDNDYAEGETFSPRREMSSVPYAFHSKTADSATDSDTLDSIDSTSFLRSDLSDTFDSGNTLTFAGDIDSNGQISIADTDITLDGASTNLTATGDFSVNTDDLFIDKATGRVGIGDSTPSFTLDINGDAQIQGGELYLTGITSSSSTTEGTMYYDNDDDNLYVYADGSWVDLTVQGGGSSLWTDGTNGYYSNTEGIIVGPDTAETLDNTGFTLSAGDLFVSDQLGVEGNIYTDGEFISGASLHLSDNHILDTNGDINIQADNDTDDYLRIDTTSDLPTIYWEGVSTYTNDPGIGIDAGGNLVYRDQDETNWRTLDSLHNSGDFSNGGEATGAVRSLGNTDNYALTLKTNDTERVYITEGETGADPYTTLLIHSDTTDGSTIFTDSSNSGHTITSGGFAPYDAHHETDQKKFGASSIEFNIKDSLDIADHSDFQFGSTPFTIDTWVYLTKVSTSQIIVTKNSGSSSYPGWNIQVAESSGLLYFTTNNNSTLVSSSNPVSLNQWSHIAVTFDGSTLYLFIDGNLENTLSISSIQDYAGSVQIGYLNTTHNLDAGYIDEFRISKGIARWTTNFSPPGAPYSGADLGAKVGIGTTSPNATLDVELSATGISTDKTIFTANTTGSTFDTSVQSLTNYTSYLTNTSTESAGTNDLTNIALYASASGADNNYAAIFENGSVGIGTTSPNHTLDVNGNIGLATSSYINWGSTDGSSGYGFRDNSGTMEFKNSAGSWTAFGSGGSSLWTDGTNGYYSNTEGIIVGPDTAETLDNTGFTLSAGDLFVSDQLGVEGNIYTDGSFYMDGGEIEQKAGDPTLAGSLIDSINTNGAFSVYISGKYAYVAGFFSDSLAIVDISDPTSPTLAGSLSDSTNMDNPRSVYVSGKYAYVAGGDSNSLAIVDISDPTSPTLAGSLVDSTNMDYPRSVYISGKYAYVAGGDSDSLAILDISGIQAPAATIGDLNTSTLDVTENASIANDLYVNNGLMVGTGGILSSGPTSTNTDLPTNYATTVKNNGNNTNRYGMLISAGEDSGSGTLIQFNDGDGTDVGEITFSGTTTTYGTSSDRRMKENIISTSMGIEDLMKVQVRDYEFKSDNTDMTYTGFIAQELIEVFPHAVFAPDDGRMWSVDYGKITPLLAKAIQDQQGMIDNLNNITTDLTTSLTDQTTTNQEKFTIIGESITELTNELNNYQTETNNSLTTLTTTIENLNDLTTLMTDTLTNHEERIQNLEAQISNLTGNPIDPDNPTNNLTTIPDNLNILSNKLTTETIITTEIDPETGEEITTESYLFDVEGNLKAKALITDKVSLDESSKEENEKTIGTAIIEAGMNEVLVTTDAINPNSKVFVTVTSEIPVLWSIAERKDGELEEQKSFKIRIAEPVTEMINFDWWIVEAK